MAKNEIKISANVADTVRPALAGADRHPGWHALRSIAARITTPLLPDDYLKLANPLWSARELRGRVLEVRRETEDSATLVIKPGWGFSFDYEPGQYVGIGVLMDGRWRWRSYSLTSSPCRAAPATSTAATITITVKAMPEGFLSSHLVGGLSPGTVVRLAAPQGNFVMPDPAPASVLFLTAGSGITPVMSMLRTLARRDADRRPGHVVHVHSAPTESDVMFGAELAGVGRRARRLPAAAARHAHRGPAGSVPARRRSARLARSSDLGVRSGGHAQRRPRRRGRRQASPSGCTWRGSRCRGPPVHGQGGTVEFARSGKTVTVDAATPLMDAGESVGVRMPFGCRMGICQSCVVELVDGHVRDLRSGVEHEPGNRIQTCISAASGDCVLDV